MILKEIIEKFEKKVPKSLAYDWDNVGLLVGNEEQEIKKIMTTLEITDVVLDEAIEKNIDLIFTHHPMMFSKINKIVNSDIQGRKLLKLIKNDISVYAAHTNLDIVKDGLNDYMLRKLEFEGVKDEFESDAIRYFKLNRKHSIYEIADKLKNIFNLEKVRIVESKKEIEKIAIVVGAGDSFIDTALLNGIDLLITGDLKHHISLDAKEKGISLIDIEHFIFEKEVSKLLKEILSDIVEDVEIFESEKIEKVFKLV